MQVTEINTGRIDVAGGRDPLTQKQQICGRVAAELRKRFG